MRVWKQDPITGKMYVTHLKDVAPYWFYDTKVIKKDATTTTFFDQQRVNPIDTNMLQPNTLPSDWTFHLNAIRVFVDISADPHQIAALIFNSILKFTKEGTEVFKAPAFVFNAGAGVNGLPTNGWPSTQAVLSLPISLQLKGNQPFAFELIKDVNLSSDIMAKVVLDGIVYKNIPIS